MKTIGAIKSVRQEGAELQIYLYRIADVTNVIRLCYDVGKKDSAIATAIAEYANKMELTFSQTLGTIRLQRKITIPLSSEDVISVVEIYDENDRNNMSKKFNLN